MAINRRDPVIYLMALYNDPAGSRMQGINEWIGQTNAAVACPEIDNGQLESLQRLLIALQAIKISILEDSPNAYLDEQKIKASQAVTNNLRDGGIEKTVVQELREAGYMQQTDIAYLVNEGLLDA
jgi:hypothetical protein